MGDNAECHNHEEDLLPASLIESDPNDQDHGKDKQYDNDSRQQFLHVHSHALRSIEAEVSLLSAKIAP